MVVIMNTKTMHDLENAPRIKFVDESSPVELNRDK